MMKCSICGFQIDLVEDAIEQGWTPYFYDGDKEHEIICSDCAGIFLQVGSDGEWEVKEEFRGKIKFLEEQEDKAYREKPIIGLISLDGHPVGN